MPLVQSERQGRVAQLTLARPSDMNAINSGLIEELGAGLDEAASDPTVGAVLIAAEGRAFCAGADLKEALEKTTDAEQFRAWLQTWRHVFRVIETMGKPVFAGVQGLALAGGLELVLSCDGAIASTEARFGDAHINFGLVPGGGGSKRLPDAIGTRAARWLMYTGEVVDAQRAYELGMVQHVLPSENFLASTRELVSTIAERSPVSLAFMKRQSRACLVDENALDYEVEAAVGVVTGADAREGLLAFTEKRKPAFPSIESFRR